MTSIELNKAQYEVQLSEAILSNRVAVRNRIIRQLYEQGYTQYHLSKLTGLSRSLIQKVTSSNE